MFIYQEVGPSICYVHLILEYALPIKYCYHQIILDGPIIR